MRLILLKTLRELNNKLIGEYAKYFKGMALETHGFPFKTHAWWFHGLAFGISLCAFSTVSNKSISVIPIASDSFLVLFALWIIILWLKEKLAYYSFSSFELFESILGFSFGAFMMELKKEAYSYLFKFFLVLIIIYVSVSDFIFHFS